MDGCRFSIRPSLTRPRIITVSGQYVLRQANVVLSLGQPTMLGNLKILGFRWERYRQWWNVLREEKGRISFGDWFRLGVLALKGITTGEKGVGFSCKMRKCGRCMIYDSEAKKCRPFDGSDLGCGCYMPFKVALGGGCWADEEGIDEDYVGWKSKKR